VRTVPRNTNSRLVSKPAARTVVVHLRGKTRAVAELRGTANGEQTIVTVRLTGFRSAAARGVVTASLANGSCTNASGLTSPTVLGPLRALTTSWTTSTPLAQLTAAPLAVVLRSPGHGVIACGNARMG
jgi:hypothetical protein